MITNPVIRFNIAFALGYIKDNRVIPFIEQLLQDEDVDVRDRAAFSIQMNGLDSKTIRESLINLLNDENHAVRLEAIYSLCFLKDQRVIPFLQDEIMKTRGNLDFFLSTAVIDLCDPSLISVLGDMLMKYGDPNGIIQETINEIKQNVNDLL